MRKNVHQTKKKRFAFLQTAMEGDVDGSLWWKSRKKVCDITRKGEVQINGERTQRPTKASG